MLNIVFLKFRKTVRTKILMLKILTECFGCLTCGIFKIFPKMRIVAKTQFQRNLPHGKFCVRKQPFGFQYLSLIHI